MGNQHLKQKERPIEKPQDDQIFRAHGCLLLTIPGQAHMVVNAWPPAPAAWPVKTPYAGKLVEIIGSLLYLRPPALGGGCVEKSAEQIDFILLDCVPGLESHVDHGFNQQPGVTNFDHLVGHWIPGIPGLLVPDQVTNREIHWNLSA
jgi:hypothetical protein